MFRLKLELYFGGKKKKETYEKLLHFKIHGIRALESFTLQQKCQSISSIFGTTEWPPDHFDFIKACFKTWPSMVWSCLILLV